MSNLIILPKCEVCGARGCKIRHSKNEIEVSSLASTPIFDKYNKHWNANQAEYLYSGDDSHVTELYENEDTYSEDSKP